MSPRIRRHFDEGTPIRYVTARPKGKLGTLEEDPRTRVSTRFAAETVGNGDIGTYVAPMPAIGRLRGTAAWHLTRTEIEGKIRFVVVHRSMFEEVKR